jgi:class 3 adenylate cyclase
MPCLSLRLIIGTVAAVAVVGVAAVSISLLATSSFAAINSLANTYVKTLSAEGQSAVADSVNSKIVMMEQLANLTRTRSYGFPSDDLNAYNELNAAHLGAFVSTFRTISSLTTFFPDNTRIMYKYDPHFGTPDMFVQTNFRPTSLSFGPTPQVQQSDFKIYSYIDGSEVGPSAPQYGPLNRTLNVGNFFWTVVGRDFNVPAMLQVIDNQQEAVVRVPSVLEYDDGRGVIVYGNLALGMYTPAFPPHLPAGPFGAIRTTYYTTEFNEQLASLKSTPNSIAVAYYQDLSLQGTSEGGSIVRSEPPLHPTAKLPNHCALVSFDATRINCRKLLSQTGVPILEHLAADRQDFLLDVTNTVERIDFDGELYYAAAGQVNVRARGETMYLLVTLPQSDVLGSTIRDQNVAIGVAVAIVVVVGAMILGLIHILLLPLTTIAERMQKAANFEDDEADGTVSSISEVAALQEAYYALNDELNRIRSFVPQSVLAAKKVTAESSDDDANLASDVMSYRSMASRRSDGYQGGRRKAVSSNGKTAGTTNTSKSRASSDGLDAAMVARKQVSIVCANLNGLHKATMANLAQDAMVTEIGMAVAAMESAVSARQGVLSFHGDRMLATFNAARPCAQHASKAASAAVAASHAHNSQAAGPLRLMLSCGVSTGSCVVGSLGSDGVKSFSVVGTAVTEAAVLERLTRAHDVVAVLATHRTCMELEATASAMCTSQYVDLVALRGRDGVRPVAVAALTPKATSDNAAPADEWMYVLDSQARANASPFDGVFELLQSGDLRTAVKVYDDICAKLSLTPKRETADVPSTPLMHPDGFVMTADATTSDDALPLGVKASCNGALPARLTTIMQHARQALAAPPTNNTQQQQTGPATSLPLCRDELFGVRSAMTH